MILEFGKSKERLPKESDINNHACGLYIPTPTSWISLSLTHNGVFPILSSAKCKFLSMS